MSFAAKVQKVKDAISGEKNGKPAKAPRTAKGPLKATRPAKVAKDAKTAKEPKPAKAAATPLPEPGVILEPYRTGRATLADLVMDAALVVRNDASSPDTVAAYQHDMEAGDKFPPIAVFEDDAAGKEYLADGRNRVSAALSIGHRDFQAKFFKGTKEDAIWYALHANVIHDKSGLRRTYKDKRKAIHMCLGHPRWSKLSARAIALHLNVSHVLVNQVKKELAAKDEDSPRTTVDPKGLTSAEAVSAERASADAAAQAPGAGSSSAPESVSPAAPRISDEEYLDRCKVYAKLDESGKKRFAESALWDRRLRESPEYQAFHRLAMGGINKAGGGPMGPAKSRVLSFLRRGEPQDWKLCADCTGKGCQSCKKDGFVITGR